jgi:uncharacterized membrane protein
MMFLMAAACLLAGIIVYPHLPALMVSHWNIHGMPDGAMSKFWSITILPLIMLVLIGIWAILPPLDPLQGIKRFRYVYDFFWFVIIAFLAYTYALMLGVNLGWQLNFLSTLLPALALLLFILGALLPYTKRNWYFGIRTPWTLSSDAAWDKTHRLSSYLLEFSALVTLFGLVYPASILWFILVPVLASAVIAVVYSYFAYRAEQVH